jgi:hypothetical protein
VNKSKLGGMQGKAWCFGVIRNLRGTKRTAVFHVATERLTDFRQLNADLVGAACFESAFELGEVPDPAKRSDVSDHRKTGSRFVIVRSAPQPVTAVTNLHGTQGLCGDVSGDNAQIAAMDRVRCKLANQFPLCEFCPCKNHDATGLTVDPVNHFEWSGDRATSTATLALFEKPDKCFIERWLPLFFLLGPVNVSGMSHGEHPGGLVSHDEVVVGMQDCNVSIARGGWQRVGMNFEPIAGVDSAGFFDAENPVDGNSAGSEQVAGSGPAGAGLVIPQRGKDWAGGLLSDNECRGWGGHRLMLLI